MSISDTTRRDVLKRGGRLGLAATLGAGLAGMFGEGSSKAATTTTTTTTPASPDAVSCIHNYWRSGACGSCGAGFCCAQVYYAYNGNCTFYYQEASFARRTPAPRVVRVNGRILTAVAAALRGIFNGRSIARRTVGSRRRLRARRAREAAHADGRWSKSSRREFWCSSIPRSADRGARVAVSRDCCRRAAGDRHRHERDVSFRSRIGDRVRCAHCLAP